jgi:hypothetical protein
MSEFGWQEMLGLLASGAVGSLLAHGYQKWLKKGFELTYTPSFLGVCLSIHPIAEKGSSRKLISKILYKSSRIGQEAWHFRPQHSDTNRTIW